MIEFTPADPEIVRDYLQLITLSQAHIIDPQLLETIYLRNKRDLRRTLTQIQFWCQFGIGDTRGGAEWINWNDVQTDWMISHGTIHDGVEWRQENVLGSDTVLEIVETDHPGLDIEDLFFPRHFHDQFMDS